MKCEQCGSDDVFSPVGAEAEAMVYLGAWQNRRPVWLMKAKFRICMACGATSFVMSEKERVALKRCVDGGGASP